MIGRLAAGRHAFTDNPSAGFYVVIVSSATGVALAPVLAQAIRREDGAASRASADAR